MSAERLGTTGVIGGDCALPCSDKRGVAFRLAGDWSPPRGGVNNANSAAPGEFGNECV